MSCVRGHSQGRSVGSMGGQGMDDHAFVAFVPGKGRGQRVYVEVFLLKVLRRRGIKKLLAILHHCKP